MRPFLDRYGIREGRSLPGGGVSGIAMPFETSDQRPGIAFSDEGELLMFEYKVYAAKAFDAHISAGTPIVQFQFQHGGRQHDGSNANPLASIPIGRIESLEATPAALLFAASFNSTSLSQEVQIAVGRNELTDISTGLMIEDFELDTDSEKRAFVRVTQARVLDVSIVDHSQFPQARILEHLALSVTAESFAARRRGDETLIGAIERYAALDKGTPIGFQAKTTVVATSAKNGPGDDEMVVTKAAWGNLWGALNDLRTVNATLRLQVPK